MTDITFYGGIDEIGGNKFLLEDKGTRVFLDFGMQMGKANEYFAEFTQPRILNGMGDLFEFGLLPKIHGIYRKDYSKHTNFDDDHTKDTDIDGVLLSHAHVDHCAYIHYLRPEIPIYCTEATKLIMQVFQDTGSHEEYITYKENFHTYQNRNGTQSRAKTDATRTVMPRAINIIQPYKKFKIDSIEIEPVPVDHSLPGVCGFIIYTSKGTIGYTADLRFHGRRRSESQTFVEKCAKADLDHILCEGTRIDKTSSQTEYDVEDSIKKITEKTQKLVVASYPVRDLDRLLSFYNAAKNVGRYLVVDMKQAYLLKLFGDSKDYSKIYPTLDDPIIKIFNPRKSWGLVDKDWDKKLVLGDYKKWEHEFIGAENSVIHKDISSKQKEYMFYCNDFRLHELIDIRPSENSSYIRSSTEPFDDEMRLDHNRIKRWLIHFGLLNSEKNWDVMHVSGHGSGDQIGHIVEQTKAKSIIPIHTTHKEHFEKLHDNVKQVKINGNLSL